MKQRDGTSVVVDAEGRPAGTGVTGQGISELPPRLTSIRRTLASALLIFLASTFVVGAQNPSHDGNSATTRLGSISGVVLDPSDAPVGAAKVTLTGSDVEKQASTTTDKTGEFRFDGLAPNTYDLEVQQQGFKNTKTRVNLGSQALPHLKIVLQLAELHVDIAVINPEARTRVSTDVGDNADAITLNRQLLDSLPIMGNDIVGAIQGMLGPDSLGSGGATLIVDGVQTSEVGVPLSAIEEIKINQNPFSAEFAAPGQKRIEIITKSGSSDYHASVLTQFRDYQLDARNAFATQRPAQQHLLLDAYFSGPLGKSKKTTFLLSGERTEDNLQPVVNAQTPSGPTVLNVPNPQHGMYLSSRINRKFGQGSVFSVDYSFFDWSDKGEGVGGYKLPETASDTTSRRHYLTVTDRALIGSSITNELYIRGVASDSLTSSRSDQPSIIVLDAFTGGGGQQYRKEDKDSVDLTEMLSWSHGKHFVKAGVNASPVHFNLDDRSNFGGTFQFSSNQDYVQNHPFSFVQDKGDSRLGYWQEELGYFVQDEIRLRPNFSVAVGLRYDWQNHISNPKNFAPRASFAFSPVKSGAIVFRGGAGLFHQFTSDSAIADTLRLNGQTVQEIVISNPSYPDPFSLGGFSQSQPSSVARFAPDLRLPYTLQYTFGVETQLRKSTTFTATYIGNQGFHLFRSRDINAPLPPLYIQRPDPSIGTLREIESAGRLKSNAVKLEVQTNIKKVLNGMVEYTFASSHDNTGGIDWFPANQYDLTGEWARTDRDVRHTFSVYGTLKVGKLFNLGAIVSARSGRPYTLTTGTDDYGTTFANARPAGVSRNSLQGPGAMTVDVRWTKEFFLHRNQKEKDEGISTKLGVDAFNVLNRVNLGLPVGNLSSPFFGQSTGADSARRVQLSLGFQF